MGDLGVKTWGLCDLFYHKVCQLADYSFLSIMKSIKHGVTRSLSRSYTELHGVTSTQPEFQELL